MKSTMVGPPGRTDIVQEGKILNRVVRVNKEGWEYESDQRHVEIIVEQLELISSKSLGTPGIEDTTGKEGEPASPPLPAEAASLYRAITARANYLAQDRSDIQFAVKELCRRMSDPDEACWARLKRLGRYLRGRSRAVTLFPWQATMATQDVYTDANWAGCKPSRKSTSGGTLLLGSHCLKTWSKTQGTIAESSAESELLAIVRAASEAIGMVSLAADFGIELQTRIHVDASAALGILERRGVGRVRHLDVGALWLQEQHLRKVIKFVKVKGTDNPTDLMTKHLAKDLIDRYMVQMGFVFREGRSDATAQLPSAHAEGTTDRRNGVTHSPSRACSAPHTRESGWKTVGAGRGFGCFRGARAFRAPETLEIPWSRVTRRVTRDAETGGLIEDIHPAMERVTREAGLSRMQHVADVEIAVEFDEEDNAAEWKKCVGWADATEEEFGEDYELGVHQLRALVEKPAKGIFGASNSDRNFNDEHPPLLRRAAVTELERETWRKCYERSK